MARVYGAPRLEHVNYYDSVGLANNYNGYQGWQNGIKLFGNANVGDLHRTNMQAAGQFSRHDDPVVVQRWYARTNLPTTGELADAFNLLAHSTAVTFVIGNRVSWQMSLFELLERRPRAAEHADHVLGLADPWPEIVPVRQNVAVQLDRFNDHAFQQVMNLLTQSSVFNSAEQFGLVPPLVWVHLEGVSCPAKVADQIGAAMVKRRVVDRSIEEDVVAWIMGIAKHPDTQEPSQLVAIADGILEGKHRAG